MKEAGKGQYKARGINGPCVLVRLTRENFELTLGGYINSWTSGDIINGNYHVNP